MTTTDAQGAVITGGGRGIGAALARRLARRGIPVVIAARTAGELARTREAIGSEVPGARVLDVVCDVTDARAVERLRDAADGFFRGPTTLLVNNAGIAPRASVVEMDEALWDAVVGVNLKATWLCTRAFLPAMVAHRGGRVVNVASISSTLGTPRLSAYCAAKWGVIGFTRSVAEEVREANVQVMALMPGSTDTEMLKGSGFPPMMSADDVARSLEWLGLDAPSAMTGSAVPMFG